MDSCSCVEHKLFRDGNNPSALMIIGAIRDLPTLVRIWITINSSGERFIAFVVVSPPPVLQLPMKVEPVELPGAGMSSSPLFGENSLSTPVQPSEMSLMSCTAVHSELQVPSSTCRPSSVKLEIRTTQDEEHRHMHSENSEQPLEWRLRTNFTNMTRRVPGMDLMVTFAKSAIRQERIPIADRTVSQSVSVFSRKRLIAKIESRMMIIGINLPNPF